MEKRCQYYKTWVNQDILKISDLLDNHDQFLSFESFKRKFNVRCTFLDYAGVLAAIPKAWKRKITCNSVGGVSELPKADSNSDDIVSAKKARLKDVYELPFTITVENRLRSFQHKLIHNITLISHSIEWK